MDEKIRSASIHLLIPIDLLDALERAVKEGKFPNRTQAILQYAKLGMRIDSLKEKIKDPEFMKTMQESWTESKIKSWIDTIPYDQQQTLAMALELQRGGKELDFRCI